MAFALKQLDQELAHDLPDPLRVAIGLHVGPVILGEMGFGRATSFTAVGDTLNVAARLEALTKEFDVQMAVSTASPSAPASISARSRSVRSRSAAAAGLSRCGWSRTPAPSPSDAVLPVAAAASSRLLDVGRRALGLGRS